MGCKVEYVYLVHYTTRGTRPPKPTIIGVGVIANNASIARISYDLGSFSDTSVMATTIS